jgi:urease accessory protein
VDRFVELINGHCQPEGCKDAVTLAFAEREKARQRVQLESGEDIAVNLKRGSVMRGGDYLMTEAGRYVLVECALENVSTVTTDGDLVRIAYHLGNRHVALEVGEDWVRYLEDYVLDEMVVGLGGTIHHEPAPFEPEGGAYRHHHD